MTTDLSPSSADTGGATRAPVPRSSVSAGSSVLHRLTRIPDDVFARQYWGRAALLVRTADDRGFTDLLDLDGVDEMLSRRGLRTPFLRLARNGSVVGSSAFTAPGGAGAEIGDQVRDDKVAGLFADGTTVVLQALHRTWSPIIDLATELGAELAHPVQVNAYVTPSGSRGFSAHYDVHDVFVLQLAGTKRWTIHEPVHPDPLRSQPWNDHADAVAARARDDAPAFEAVLAPGDVMYLPRGWLHAATAQGEISAHLTVGVHVVTDYALVEALMAAVAADPRLRGSLPTGLDVGDPDALGPHLDRVRAALHDALDSVAPAAVARHARRRVWAGARLEPVRPLATAAFVEHLATGDTVRVRAGLGHHVTAPDDSPDPADQLVLELPDRRITLPAATRAAVRRLLEGDVESVGTLPGLDPAEQIVLVRRLLKEGVLVPASP